MKIQMETLTFPEWLAAEMKARKINQTELAAKSGVTPAQISRILSGQRGAEGKTLTAIAVALKVPPEIVLRIAGVLPEDNDDELDEIDKRILHLIKLLPYTEKEKFAKRLELETQFYEQPKPTRTTNKTRP